MAKYEGEVLNEKPEQIPGAATPPTNFDAEYKNKADQLKADYDKKVKELTTTTLKIGGDTYEIPSELTSTPVVAAATVAGLYGAKKVGGYALDKASSALEGIKSRMINKNDNVLDVQSRTIVPEDIPEEWKGLYAKSQQNAAAKAADAAAKANPVPQNYTPSVPTAQPNAPVNPAGAFTQPSGYGQTTSNIQGQFNQPNVGSAPIVPTAEVGPPPPVQPANVVSTGPTPEAAAAPIEKAAEVKKVVEPSQSGMKPNYNKTKKNVGPGAYNWLAGQEGPKAPEVWRNLVGEKNIPYNEFMENVKPLYEGYLGSYGEPDPFKQVAKPGEYKRPSMVPENIRGSSNLKGLAGLAGTAGLLMAATTPEAKAAMARASESIKDIGISPEAILRGKGDELGRMGNAYVTAGNPNYLRELKSQLDVETDPERRKILLQEFQKIGGSGAGRGIAPPSAYMR
jgi:hypothetical protein